MNRREALRLLAAATTALGTPGPAFGAKVGSAPPSKSATLSPADEIFLDDMQRRACLFFTEQAGAKSGQVLDRAAAAGTGQRDPRKMASIAATGFGLTGLCIADKRRYQPRKQLVEQARRTLRFHLNNMPHDHGFLYHFNDVDTGQPWRDTEVSSIDTALLLCGALTARAHFSADPDIVSLATKLYERVDWPWMLNGGATFSMGLRQGKFIDARWNHFCELMMIYLLALGSSTHPVAPATWDAWSRPTITYEGLTYISSNDPIFTQQYSHAWFDFRGKRDKYADYFTNSITATRAHKAFCLSLGQPYSPDYWGISASDSQHGYTAWGGPSSTGPRLWRHRRLRRSQCHSRLAAVCARRLPSRPAVAQTDLPAVLRPLRLLRRSPSGRKLVRSRRPRDRPRHRPPHERKPPLPALSGRPSAATQRSASPSAEPASAPSEAR